MGPSPACRFLCAITTKIHQTELRGFNAGNCGAKRFVIGLINESRGMPLKIQPCPTREQFKGAGSDAWFLEAIWTPPLPEIPLLAPLSVLGNAFLQFCLHFSYQDPSSCRDEKSAGLVRVTFSHPAAGVWAISHLQAFIPLIASTSNPHSYLILYICGPQAETAIPTFCLGPVYHWRFLPQLLPLLMKWLYKKREGFSPKAKSRGLGGVAQFNRVLVQCTQMPGFYPQHDINPI